MPFYKSLVDDNPIVAAGAKRRAATDADLYTSTPVDTVDPYKGQWGAETIRSQAQRLGNYVPALSGLGRQLLGDDAGAQKDYADFAKGEETARELGPAVQSFADAKKAGGGVGDYLSAIGYQGASFLPDAALAVAGGGIGGEVAGGMARRAATRALANEIEDRSVNVAARAAAKDAAAKAAAAAPDAVQGVGNAIRVANAQVDEAGRKAAMEGAAEIAGRTPRIVSDVQRAQKLGSVVGSAAGFYPATVSSSVDFLKDHPGQEAAAKVAGVDAVASLIGSLPFGHALEGLAPAAKEAAGQVIAKDAQRFLPKLVQGTALHAAGGGAAGAAMTATQLAGHKWVDDNIDLLSDDAKEKYLDSFIGGAIAGGAFHAGPAVAGKVRSAIADRLGAAGDKAGAFKEYAKGVLQSYADKVRSLHAKQDAARPQPGDEIPLDTPEGGAGSNVLDLLRRGKDAVAGVASKAADVGKSAFDRFATHKDAIHQDSTLDESVDALHETFLRNGEKIPGKLRAPNQNPVTGLGGLKDQGLSYIKTDSPIWGSPEAAKHVGASLERLMTGKKVTLDDAYTHDFLIRSGSIEPHTLDAMKIVGDQYGEALRQASEAHEASKAESNAEDLPGERRFGQEDLSGERAKNPRELLDEDSMKEMGGSDTGITARDAEPLHPVDEMNSIAAEGRSLPERIRRMHPTDDASYASTLAAERAKLAERYTAARDKLAEDLVGGKALWTENRSSEKAKSDFADRTKGGKFESNFVELDEPKIIGESGLGIRAQLLDIGKLIMKQRAKINAEGTKNNDIPAQQALLRGLSEMQQAGLDIKPSSIKQGLIYNIKARRDRNGVMQYHKEGIIGSLSKSDVEALQAGLRKQLRKQPQTHGEATLPRGTLVRGDAERASNDGRVVKDTVDAQGEHKIDSGKDDERHKLVPRETPPGRLVDGQFVPDPVADVDANNPYAAHVADATRARDSNLPPEVKRTYYHKNGIAIGEAELKYQLDNNQISERRFNVEMKRLHDVTTGLSRKYLKDAARGRYDTARVREAPADQMKAKGRDEHKYTVQEIEGAEGGVMETRAADWPDEKMRERATAKNRNRWEQIGRRDKQLSEYKQTDKVVAERKALRSERQEILRAEKARQLEATSAGRHEATESPRLVDAPLNKGTGDNGKPGEYSPGADRATQKMEPTHLDEAGVESVAKPEGPHDHAAETKMLNEVLGRLGIESRVRVIPLRPKRGPQVGGEYSARGLTVAINDNLHGSERVEVLMHELGHHIIYATLAKELGVEHTRMGRLTSQQALDMLAKSNPELHKAMLDDYNAWANAQKLGMRAIDVRSSRSPFFRARGLKERGAFDGKRMGDMSDSGQATLLDAHEWLADNIAKALASKTESQSIVGKFFSGVAAALRSAYEAVFGNEKLSGYKPAESVDKWVQGLFDANVEGVREATGASVPADAAASVVEAAAAVEGATRFNPNDMSDMATYAKQFGEYVRTVLPLEERQILDRVLNRASSVKVLRAFADGNPVLLALLDDAARGMENRVMLGFMAWKGGKLKTGTEGGNAFAQVGDNMAKIFGATGEGDLAQRVFNDIANGAVQRFHDASKTYSVRELEARSRGNVQRALNWVNKRGKVGEATSKFLEGSKSRLWHSGVPAAREFLTRIQRPQGTTRDELMGAKLPPGEGLTPSLVHTLAKYEKSVREAIGHLSRKQQVTVLDMLQRQMTPEHPKWAIKSQAARDATLAVRKIMDQSYNYLREAGIKNIGRQENFFPVVIDLRNEAAKKSLFDLYNQPEKFEQPIREFFGKTEREGAAGSGKAERAANYPPADPKATDYFGKQRAKWEAAGRPKVAETNQSILDAITHGSIKDIQKQIELSEKRKDRLAASEHGLDAHLERAMDLEQRYMHARIKQLQDAGVGHETPTYTGEKAKDTGPGTRKPSEAPFEDLVRKLVDGAIEEHGFSTTGSDTPNFRGMNHRVSNFIYTHGDAKDVRAFANLQSKNAADVFARYLGPMVKRAEYARHFGANGEVKTKLFDDMRKQGATEDQVAEADNVLKAALGTYGAEGSPVLNMISPALAKRLHTKATRDVVSGAQAYQNTRLLPLALLSSLVDPMGIAVRTGGDFGLMWQGFKGGMKALTDKATREELHGMLEQLGAANDTLFILQSGFGGSSDHTVANKVNEFVFRMNGMESWVTNTRYQALLAAHGFLLKHAGGNASPHSQRYMQELQLQPGDVRSEIQQRPDGKQVQRVALLTDAQRKAASSEEVARDDRVRNALRTFVDDAILRPNSTQRPLWHNDPYMGLLTQYKAFGYAIYDQIAGRLSREMQHGNMKVMNAALAYVPIVILSEMIRGVLQYGAGGNPNRDDWGPGDYLAMGVQRSGLPGPTVNFLHDVKGDFDRKNLPGSSQLGPTIGQLSNAADALEGRRDLGKEFESALPGSAAYQHLDDEGTGGDATTPTRKAA